MGIPKDYKFDGYLYDYICHINDDYTHLDNEYYDVEVGIMMTRIKNKYQQHVVTLNITE